MACCRGLSSCSRVLSFVSCLQMQQKVKVTTCFDLLIFLFRFGLYTSCPPPLPSPPLPISLVPCRRSPPRAPVPLCSPTWLKPRPSLVFHVRFWVLGRAWRSCSGLTPTGGHPCEAPRGLPAGSCAEIRRLRAHLLALALALAHPLGTASAGSVTHPTPHLPPSDTRIFPGPIWRPP